MDARYTIRKHQWLDECQVAPEIFEQVIPRLSTFMKPFVTIFQGQVAEQHATTAVCGLLANLARQNIASIASRFGSSRLPLQACIGWDAWDDEPWRSAWRSQVTMHLGQGDGVLVFDPSGFAKSGRESVGVARQWCGRLGKVDHCQVAMDLGYVSRKGHTLVDQRLFLPKMAQGYRPPGQSRCAQGLPSLSHAPPVGLGDVDQKRCRAAPELDRR